MDEQLCSKFSLAIEGLAMHLDSCRVVYAPNNAQERTPKRRRSYSDWLACKKTKGQTEVKREWSLLSNFILWSKREVAIQLLDFTV